MSKHHFKVDVENSLPNFSSAAFHFVRLGKSESELNVAVLGRSVKVGRMEDPEDPAHLAADFANANFFLLKSVIILNFFASISDISLLGFFSC